MSFRLERLLDADDLAEQLRREARDGLTATPKRMRSRWIWDARAASLYEQIMELPDYYPAPRRARDPGATGAGDRGPDPPSHGRGARLGLVGEDDHPPSSSGSWRST